MEQVIVAGQAAPRKHPRHHARRPAAGGVGHRGVGRLHRHPPHSAEAREITAPSDMRTARSRWAHRADRPANRPRFARRSMALTRATGKACRLALSWIMALAGYQSCPAEEMEGALVGTATVPTVPSVPDRVSPKQLTEFRGLMREAGADEGRFCSYLKIRGLGELEASRFDPAAAALRRKLGKVAP